jgi:hypothetical protein
MIRSIWICREVLFDPADVGIDDLLEVASLVGFDPFRVKKVDLGETSNEG